jgi:hypothetical protein
VVRSSRNIVLTLLGSAALLGCCCTSCVDFRDEVARDANGNELRDDRGNVVHHRHYYYRPWYHSGGYGYSPFWTSTRSYSPSYSSTGRSGGTSTGGSSHSSGTTSRGGFGSTGHATAGG